MTDYAITPPSELVQQWFKEVSGAPVFVSPTDEHIATRAAQWGADVELAACCEWLDYNCPSVGAHHLRAARRPKPPSLKEEALKALGPEPLPETCPTGDAILNKGSIERYRTIRRALEALPE